MRPLAAHLAPSHLLRHYLCKKEKRKVGTLTLWLFQSLAGESEHFKTVVESKEYAIGIKGVENIKFNGMQIGTACHFDLSKDWM